MMCFTAGRVKIMEDVERRLKEAGYKLVERNDVRPWEYIRTATVSMNELTWALSWNMPRGATL